MKAEQEPVQFCGVPLVRLFPINHGWQVQERESETSEIWTNVPKGWFQSYAEAEEQAPYLCHF